MKVSVVFLVIFAFLTSPLAVAEDAIPLESDKKVSKSCDTETLKSDYIPLFAEDGADLPEEDLLKPALRVCEIKQKTNVAINRIQHKVSLIKENAAACAEMDTDPGQACGAVYSAKLNEMIDKCQEITLIGKNPHNLETTITKAELEGHCMNAVADLLDRTVMPNE